MRRTKLLVLLLGLLLSSPALSKSIGDVEIPEQVRLPGVERALVLNGAGIRKKFFISVYVGALYLPTRQTDVQELLTAPTANRVLMHFVYSRVAKRKMDDAWREGFENNLTESQHVAVSERLERFVAMFGDMYEGDQVWLDFVPGSGTRVSINGVLQGTIAGADFNAALLAVWLGRHPVSESLKNAMVGVDNS